MFYALDLVWKLICMHVTSRKIRENDFNFTNLNLIIFKFQSVAT